MTPRFFLRSRLWLWVSGLFTLMLVVTTPFALTVWRENLVYLVALSQVTALFGSLWMFLGTLSERKANPKFPEHDPEEDNIS